MQRVGARLGDDVDGSAGGPANLSGVHVGLNADFLDRVDRRMHTDGADDALVVVHAVHQLVIDDVRLPIHGH